MVENSNIKNMKQIRQNVWETNSSSTHSVSVAETLTEDMMDTITPNEEGVVVLTGGEWGWEINDYYDAETKANYMLVYLMARGGDRLAEMSQMLKDVIMEQTGCTDVDFQASGLGWRGMPDFGYIDHQSIEDDDYHFIFEDKEILRRFIFSRESWLHTDNDNH